MAEVYWIRKQEHTDIFTQGYVGVTTKTSQDRFKEHIKVANSRLTKKSILHKIIKSIGKESLVVETVCICSEEYAYDLERKLRPSEFIGWNQIPGGTKPPPAKGRIMKDSTKQKISVANSGPASPAKLKQLEKLCFKPGHIRSEITKKKHSATLRANGPWNNPAANKSFWGNAQKFYEDYSNGLTIVDVKNKYGLTRNSLKTIFKHFKNGWIPSEDELWMKTFKEESGYV